MSRAAFLAWEARQPGDVVWERADGRPVPRDIHLGGGSVQHARTKLRVAIALSTAIGAAGLACEALIDELKVPIEHDRDFVPDAAVRCGAPSDLADEGRLLPDPMIVVEVLSRRHDDPAWAKVGAYLSVPSVRHILIVDPFRRVVVHTVPAEGGYRAWIRRPGERLMLDPPGFEVAVADLLIPVD